MVTEAQWDDIIWHYLLRGEVEAAKATIAEREFCSQMEQLQRTAGETSAQIEEVGRGILALGQESPIIEREKIR